jgi:hypothetical protein
VKFRLFSAGTLLLAVGAILSVVAALSTRSVSISVEAEFGIGNYLPSFFWIGFVLVMLGSGLVGWSGRNVHRLFALLSIALIMWCTPILVEELPRHNDSFWHMSQSQWIASHNQVTFSESRLVYLQYPSVFLFAAIWTLIGVPAFSLMIVYPIFVMVLFTLNFYLLSRKLLGGDRQAFLATALSLVGNVAMFSNHFSPSGTAQALFPLMLYAILKIEESTAKRCNLLLFLILAAFYTLLHPATPLLLLLLVFGVFLFKRSHKLKNPMILIAVLFFSWMMFVGVLGMTNLGSSLQDFMTALVNFGRTTPASYLVSHQTLVFTIVGLLKTAIFAGFVISAFLAIGWQIRKNFRIEHLNKATIFFLCSFSAFVLSSFATAIYDRVLAWIIPFSILVVMSINKKLNVRAIGGFFLVVLILIAPVTFLAFYSGERCWITTKAEYQGLSYVAANIKDTDKLLMDVPATLRYFTKYEIDYATLPFREPSPESPRAQEYQQLSLKRLDSSSIVVFRSYSYNWQYYEVEGKSYNSYTIAFNNCMHNVRFNPVYSDLDVVMFQRNGNQSEG